MYEREWGLTQEAAAWAEGQVCVEGLAWVRGGPERGRLCAGSAKT